MQVQLPHLETMCGGSLTISCDEMVIFVNQYNIVFIHVHYAMIEHALTHVVMWRRKLNFLFCRRAVLEELVLPWRRSARGKGYMNLHCASKLINSALLAALGS